MDCILKCLSPVKENRVHPTTTESGIDELDIKTNYRRIESDCQSMQGCSIPEVELRGISIKQLKDVYAEIKARCVVERWTDKDGILLTPQQCNLYDIKDRIIMKRTESQQCSYVELIATGPQKPTRFVSHWWGEPVIAMIRCLEQHCKDHYLSEETTYYWICAYANNQHKIADEMLTNPFLKAMSICEGTVSILDAECVVYSRIWCIFELFKSVMDGNSDYEFDVYTEIDGVRAVGITHGYIPSDFEDADQKKRRESKFPLDRILKATNVNVKQAQASVESDRKFILNSITGRSVDDAVVDDHANYDELNNILRGIFVSPALERITKEKDVDTITRCLEIVKASNVRIINLDLKDCSRFDDDILMKLVHSLPPTLSEFSLVSIGSAVTVNGINACLGKILGCPQLVRLELRYNNIDADGAKIIADGLKNNHSLKGLFLDSNIIGVDGAKQIADALNINHSLEALFLDSNNVGADGAKMIADALQDNHSLQALSLDSNNIGANGAKVIADALNINDTLKLLGLGDNKIGDNGTKMIVAALQVNQTLESLNLGCNDIGADGAKMIADALQDTHSLKALDLTYNNIGNGGKEYLEKKMYELEDANRKIFIDWKYFY